MLEKVYFIKHSISIKVESRRELLDLPDLIITENMIVLKLSRLQHYVRYVISFPDVTSKATLIATIGYAKEVFLHTVNVKTVCVFLAYIYLQLCRKLHFNIKHYEH